MAYMVPNHVSYEYYVFMDRFILRSYIVSQFGWNLVSHFRPMPSGTIIFGFYVFSIYGDYSYFLVMVLPNRILGKKVEKMKK